MQSLVYDFGQLDSDTERNYARKIIENYVRILIVMVECTYLHMFIQEQKIMDLDVYGVTDVLMACQDYMKKKDVRDLFCNDTITVNCNCTCRMSVVLSA